MQMNTGKFTDWCRSRDGEVTERMRTSDYDIKCSFGSMDIHAQDATVRHGRDSLKLWIRTKDKPRMDIKTTFNGISGGGETKRIDLDGENISITA